MSGKNMGTKPLSDACLAGCSVVLVEPRRKVDDDNCSKELSKQLAALTKPLPGRRDGV